MLFKRALAAVVVVGITIVVHAIGVWDSMVLNDDSNDFY